MARVNTLTDHGRAILDLAENAKKHAEQLPVSTGAPTVLAIQNLADAVGRIVMAMAPTVNGADNAFWTKEEC